MNIGKSISLFLMDGTPDGVVVCELFNWTGKGFKIPRSKLKELSDRQDLKKAGIYFLIGKNEEDSDIVYVGEAENVYKRLLQHQDKDFWSEALTFVSKDENLNKAHIKYLEFILHKSATETARYKIFNSNTPNCPSISESDQAVMTEFAANLELLVGTMGYKFFQKLTKSKVAKQEKYLISAARGANATSVITSEGIVVLKGSIIANSKVPSTPQAVSKKRKELIDSGVITNFKFTKDCLFSSPSIAAAVVMGRSANGLIEWKKTDGSSIKDNQPKNKEEG
jgi:hypothetical protein